MFYTLSFSFSHLDCLPSNDYRTINLDDGEQSKGRFTQFKDLLFPKGCGSLGFDFSKPLKRGSGYAASENYADFDNVGAAQTLNEQFADAPGSFAKRTGNRRDGFYYPDFSGRYIHDNR